jgi:outer membrane protein OmpA-like peptidoglycan-associated protein
VAAPARDAARDAGDAARRAADATDRALADLGAFFTRRLPNGVELDIPSLGIENKVVEFIEDTGQPLEPARWFDFDRLLFATNSATLEPQSQEQLGNIAKILEAYPSVRVKIGGYTDNTGSPAANLKLSQDRATSVRNELVRLGVPGERLEAEGYGQEHPVADNSTEAGRAQNRRIALRVTQR